MVLKECPRGISYDAQSEKISYDDVWEIYSLRCNTWEKLDVNMPPDSNGDLL